MDIWAACRDAAKPVHLEGELVRVVESQEQIATNRLVDNLDEQNLLEEMLDSSKPPVPPGTEKLHYLLSTPFRYPPLRHGSRFGTRDERSIFYASATLNAALAETAYYRFVFWYGMVTPPPAGKITSEHTIFGATFSTDNGLCLHKDPFLPFKASLVNPGSYADTQLLGSAIREAGFEAMEYQSARDPEEGINIALFRPGAFVSKEPDWQKYLLCEIRSQYVSFYNKEYGTRVFPYEIFLVEGDFPLPSI